jgi:hypothetical protein
MKYSPFCVRLIHLAYLQGSSMLEQVSEFHSFLRLDPIVCVQVYVDMCVL